MANQKISELTAVVTPADTDLFEVTQSSTSKSTTRAQVRGFDKTEITATDASYTLPANRLIIDLNDTGDNDDIDVTFDAALPVGTELIIYAVNNGATSHTVTLAGGQTWDGTNDTADFDTAGDFIHAVVRTATQLLVLANTGVTFS